MSVHVSYMYREIAIWRDRRRQSYLVSEGSIEIRRHDVSNDHGTKAQRETRSAYSNVPVLHAHAKLRRAITRRRPERLVCITRRPAVDIRWRVRIDGNLRLARRWWCQAFGWRDRMPYNLRNHRPCTNGQLETQLVMSHTSEQGEAVQGWVRVDWAEDRYLVDSHMAVMYFVAFCLGRKRAEGNGGSDMSA